MTALGWNIPVIPMEHFLGREVDVELSMFFSRFCFLGYFFFFIVSFSVFLGLGKAHP